MCVRVMSGVEEACILNECVAEKVKNSDKVLGLLFLCVVCGCVCACVMRA